ncbi:MetQ/NlpA family ABC transporter substrate-binding protein, partial [Salmonella enterica subsp. enterica serovar Infantis]
GVTGALFKGNFEVAAGLVISRAFKKEHMYENLNFIIALRSEDSDKPFAKDIVESEKSPANLALIEDPKNINNTYHKP